MSIDGTDSVNKPSARIFQKALKVGSAFLNWREPELLTGINAFNDLPKNIQDKAMSRILIVTDKGILETGMVDPFTEKLDQLNIAYSIFEQVEPSPPKEVIEKLAIQYKENYSEAMVAVGGGSVMDSAKAAGIIINKPEKDLSNYGGLMKVLHKTPVVFAVPTTAGTGSETTLAAIVSDYAQNRKSAIMDLQLIPEYAVLDPKMTESLPASLTAETGMDALTHAVEAYIGKSNTKKTKKYAEKAIELIDQSLYSSYLDGSNLEYRENMLDASYYAGASFTRAYVGNVHAISHALTAYYRLPHGRTNATILPIILKIYREQVEDKLVELADLIDIAPKSYSTSEKSRTFIQWIESLNYKMDIPRTIPEIKDEDLRGIAEHAEAEANPLYPVPQIFSVEDFISALKIIRENN